jgi:DNA invertase Pin-like site-specific DNA recombinase
MLNDKKPTGSRGAALLRVSDDNKQDHERQKLTIECWRENLGLPPLLWVYDAGSRDLAYKRPEFLRLLGLVEQDMLDYIVVDASERFGVKNAWEFGKFVCTLREHDCELWSVREGLLSSDDAVTSILSAVNSVRSKEEQIHNSQRTLSGMVAAARRGQWNGGLPPYGFDVVAYAPDGREKWRVLYTGRSNRVRIWPDGRLESYNGKGNFPPTDHGDILRLAPSCDAQRVEMALKIFTMYAEDSISVHALARRLNALGVSPVVGQGWHTTRLRQMLRNPVYVIGQTVWSKNSHGRFLHWEDGTYKPVPRVKDRAVAFRPHSEDQYVYPESQFQGIVGRDLWEAVQAKLRQSRRSGQAPRSSDLWLGPLLFCAGCDKRMVGWHQKSCKYTPVSYTCSTYRRYGAHNPAGCRLHRANAKIIEALVEQYLRETGQGLEALLAATADNGGDGIIAGLLQQHEGRQWEYLKALHRLYAHVKATGAEPPAGSPWSHSSLCSAYQAEAQQHRARINTRLAKLDGEHTRLVQQFSELTSKLARTKANERIAALEAEMEALQAELLPLDQEAQRLREELRQLDAAVAEARDAVKGDSSRRKTQAVGGVIRRVVCRFQHVQAGSQVRSVLAEVRIEPVEGQDRVFALDIQGRRWCAPDHGARRGSTARPWGWRRSRPSCDSCEGSPRRR